MSARLALSVFAIVFVELAAEPSRGQVPTAVKRPPQPAAKKDQPEAKDAPKPAAEAPVDPIKAAEKVLQAAKIGTDTESLLKFFKERTLTDQYRAQLEATIRGLGDDDFDVRERSSEELTRAGLPALPILRAARQDANVEIARRVEICLKSISQEQETSRIIAAATLLAHQKAEGVVGAVLAYLPSVPDDEVVAEGLRTALALYTKLSGKIAPLLRAALEGNDVGRRAFALQVIAEGMPADHSTFRKLLNDQEARIRYLAAYSLVRGGDQEALPVFLKLVVDGPMEYAFQVEDALCQLLDPDEKPPATLLGNDQESRNKVCAAWTKWIDERRSAKKLDLARLNTGEALRGLTLIVEVDGGGVNGGRIWECGQDGKQRWEITNLGGPVDVQVLAGGRLLISEYYNSRVTERDRAGTVLWESPRLTGNTVGAQRLPNGNTLIATMSTVVEYNRAKEKVAEFPNANGAIYQAIRHRNGHTFVLSGNSITEFGTDNKQVHSTNIGALSGWGGFEILPNGHFLVARYTQGNTYTEVAPDGKVISTGAPTQLNPTRVQRLRNGNTLVAGGNMMFVAEFDRDKKEVWKVATKGRPFSVKRY